MGGGGLTVPLYLVICDTSVFHFDVIYIRALWVLLDSNY